MEVHAHTHTERKKWTHYLWEFLMLFLAVFCGFLAEYLLEHRIEKEREKQFINSIDSDLKDDTLSITKHIETIKTGIVLFDSLSGLLESPESAKKNGEAIYYTSRLGVRLSPLVNNNRTIDQLKNSGGFRLINKKGKDLDSLMILLNTPNIMEKGDIIYLKGKTAPYMRYFASTDRTILQMKNSGGFRLIRNNFAANSILDYYAALNFSDQLQNINRQQAESYRNIALDIFDPMIFEGMISDKTNIVTKPEGNPRLLTYEKKQLTRLAGAIHYFNTSRRTLGVSYLEQKQGATNLISILKKEYHLK